MNSNDFMKQALGVAEKSGADVPVGALIVQNGTIISACHNEKEQNKDSTAHAEICAIKKASLVLSRWRLDDCEMYVTLEPCPMCAWAIIQSRIKTVYFGSYDIQYGALVSVLDLRKQAKSDLKVFGGILEKECDNIIKEFFGKIR
ncbi:MAG TPA: nucleoside deaminase [Candidatus Gastranaerophilaceae bacterium]|nr:nucleoside deaminase [Candidatus Gastranaerophilaceae bacterium]HPT41641.1 nucleoside deaminase [Candidatus Gastranaerophilaceae bacterium]